MVLEATSLEAFTNDPCVAHEDFGGLQEEDDVFEEEDVAPLDVVGMQAGLLDDSVGARVVGVEGYVDGDEVKIEVGPTVGRNVGRVPQIERDA